MGVLSEMTHSISKQKKDHPDALRRNLAKGGMVAPVVLASLASKQVLGASPYSCTVSGQLSGNVSSHVQTVCSSLGTAPSDYLALPPSQWPTGSGANDWIVILDVPNYFPNTPASLFYSSHFVDAYEKQRLSGAGDHNKPPYVAPFPSANVRDVLAGFATKSDGSQDFTWVYRARTGYVTDLALGREALAAYMNSINGSKSWPAYPIAPKDVIAMFNAVVKVGGTYNIAPGVSWSATEVLAYFRSLHP